MTTTQWLEVLASFSLQVLVVITTSVILDRAVRRSTDQCTIWNTCFLSIFVLGCSALLLPRLHLIQPWSSLTPHSLLRIASVQTVIGSTLLIIWGIGVTLLLARWLLRSYMLRRSLCGCETLPRTEVKSLLGDVLPASCGSVLPVILISDTAEGPYCWQLHRPAIVLPRFLLLGTREDLRSVLVHEMEHLKTNHPLQLFMQQLVQVLCWFHPAVWSAGSRASLAREFSCDDAAASGREECAAYLRTLLHIAEHCEKTKHSSTFSFGRTRSEIVVRAHRLVKRATEIVSDGQRIGLNGAAATLILAITTLGVSQLWLPTDPLASSRASYSPWPRWTAQTLHCFGYSLRDYEQFDRRAQLHELQLLDTSNDVAQRNASE